MRGSLLASFLLAIIAFHEVESAMTGIRWYADDTNPSTADKKHPKKKEDRDFCYINKTATKQAQCEYVKAESDKCEGGGYMTWTRFVMCEFDQANRIMIIISAVLFLLLLFLMISSAADDFFSPNVSAIVAHLGISESIAGVTFLAFGNGSPDIFGSIASVLSSPKPKAGLAIGELLGGCVFVTLMVTATIVLTKPFKVAKFETIRDLSFFLVTLGWTVFVLSFDSTMYTWEPLAYLGIYAIYVGTVVFSHFLHKKKRAEKRSRRSSARTATPRTRNGTGIPPDVVPEVHIISEAVEKINGHLSEAKGEGVERVGVYDLVPISGTRTPGGWTAGSRNSCRRRSYVIAVRRDSEDSEDDDGLMWTGHHLISAEENRSRVNSILPPADIHDFRTLLMDLYDHLRPLADNEWEEAGRVRKVMDVIMIPIIFVFKLTIPLCDSAWSKPISIIHAVTTPQFFLFAIQLSSTAPIDGGPGLWAYAFVLSGLLVGFVMFFTSFSEEPRFYKQIYSYAGFLMSIAWIYIIASEVVSAVTMLGVISQISHEVLGLTILAWSNSIGDLIADVAVVKQGYPNMALAAAIGGPLFNLLIGFGLPFSIARLKNTPVQINFTPVNHILCLFLGISLLWTFGSLLIQRFHFRRWYAICNIAIYLGFITMVVLAESHVFTWGGEE